MGVPDEVSPINSWPSQPCRGHVPIIHVGDLYISSVVENPAKDENRGGTLLNFKR